ncbi:MAG TPA: tautomerase family protein [Polyangia bacterium]|jgi:phenylpyruvate tautomerase PptA (4-oxalocrotonate tautomerase family)|nr:tautomerase family protein [Polyangia bacterium]
MPSVLIEIRRSIPADEETAIIDAVHAALREAFKILPGDRNVRLVAHAPHRFACPPERAKPDLYTHVSIDAFAGRSLDAKRALYRTIVLNLEALGIPRDHVKIVLREIPRENWGIRGGQAGCDVELGFKVDV